MSSHTAASEVLVHNMLLCKNKPQLRYSTRNPKHWECCQNS